MGASSDDTTKLRPEGLSMAGKRALAVATVGAAVVMGVTGCAGSSKAHDNPAITPTVQAADGAGRQTPPPWDAPANAVQYIQAAGLPALASEGDVVHYHAHLDVIVDGTAVPVPAFIGIDEQAQRISPLHTHDVSGVLHVEAPAEDTFTLGQLFTEWNVRLTEDCLGGLCAGNSKALRLYVNGKLRSGDPATLVLAKHQEIALLYGDAGATPKAPSSYDFPKGL